jgi:hypothetical protein
MFQTIKFAEDEITKATEVRVVYESSVNSEPLHDGGVFQNRASAEKWLHDTKKLWFGLRLDNYILHKKHIYETAPRGHKSITEKLEAINELQRFCLYVAEKATLQEACKWCLHEENKLTMILPGPNNSSRTSSQKELDLLINFSKQQLKQK